MGTVEVPTADAVADLLSPPEGRCRGLEKKVKFMTPSLALVRACLAANVDGTTAPWEEEQGSLVTAASGGRWSEKPELSKAAQ
uniref:Uncharacterized protein n=1 Tax=Oryza rufipogon TaxID=4529 RepID=A0A0E0P380_ORYRU